MKALILAAGRGTRLAPITDNCPKALVSVNGKPIIMKQIENLCKNHVEDITIVTGYKADRLEDVILKEYAGIRIIRSKEYENTNNMYSAYLAKEIMQNEGFLMMNADVFFDASVITALLEFSAENAIVVELGSYNEESMKVIEKDGRLVEISKNITPEKALGNSIDVYKFSAQGAKAFFHKCTEYIEKRQEVSMWSEVALNDILGEIRFEACPLCGRWMEIDNLADLEEARRIFAKR